MLHIRDIDLNRCVWNLADVIIFRRNCLAYHADMAKPLQAHVCCMVRVKNWYLEQFGDGWRQAISLAQ